ncbi:MAG: F0F1 ATP synthase subunit delta [Kineosporiaceae bacterium]
MAVSYASTLRGVSKESLVAAEEVLDSALSASTAQGVGEELFAVTDVLADNAGLRRALTDTSRQPQARAELVQRLFGGQVGGVTLDLLSGLVRARWSEPGDLTVGVEHLAVTAVLFSAEAAGSLDEVEDELFRLSRTVGSDPGLRDALSPRTVGQARKVDLLATLVAGKVKPQTQVLATRAVAAARGRRLERVLDGFLAVAAARRSRHVADITTAVPLTQAQRQRLAAALERVYGQSVRLNVQLDPEVVGGLRVQLAGEVLDGTLLTRLAAARRRLAG